MKFIKFRTSNSFHALWNNETILYMRFLTGFNKSLSIDTPL